MPNLAARAERMNQGGNSEPVPVLMRKTINYFIVGLLALVSIGKLYAVTFTPLVDGYVRNSAEAPAVQWIADNQPPGRILNSYNWGGYLIWRLPEYPVFVDGRTDLFGDEIIGEWMSIVQADEGWQKKLDDWQVRLILLEPNRPLVAELQENGWDLLFEDKGAVVYGR